MGLLTLDGLLDAFIDVCRVPVQHVGVCTRVVAQVISPWAAKRGDVHCIGVAVFEGILEGVVDGCEALKVVEETCAGNCQETSRYLRRITSYDFKPRCAVSTPPTKATVSAHVREINRGTRTCLMQKKLTAAARLGDEDASLRHLVPRSRLVIFLEVESDSCTCVIQGLGFRVRCL